MDRLQQNYEGDERLAQCMQYYQYDDIALVNNTEPFECSICFTEVAPREGAILHQCLHQFCMSDSSMQTLFESNVHALLLDKQILYSMQVL